MVGLLYPKCCGRYNSHVRIENITGLLLLPHSAITAKYTGRRHGLKMLKQNRKHVSTKCFLQTQSFMISQHSNWYIMADISKMRLNNSMVPNFVMKVDYNLSMQLRTHKIWATRVDFQIKLQQFKL